MNVLHIIRSDTTETIKKIIEEQKKDNSVELIDIRTNKDYEYIVSAIERADKIITW